MNFRIIFSLLLASALGVLSGCVFTDGSFHEKELTSLRLTVADNPGLRKEYVAEIDQGSNTVTLNVPNYVDPKTLVPRLEFTGRVCSVNGIPTQSPAGRLDFSQALEIEVGGLDDAQRVYQVQVQVVPPSSDKELEFLAIGNETSGPYTYGQGGVGYWVDQYAGIWSKAGSVIRWSPFGNWNEWETDLQNDILSRYEYGYLGNRGLNKVHLYLRHSGVSASLDGVPIKNDDVVFDLSRERSLSISAEDGTSQNLQLQVVSELGIDISCSNASYGQNSVRRLLFRGDSRIRDPFDQSNEATFSFASSLDREHAILSCTDACGYPLTLADTVLTYGEAHTVDLSSPLVFTVTNPYGDSQQFTLYGVVP